MAAGRRQTLQLVADGSDANSAGVSLGYASNLIAAYAQELVAHQQVTSASTAPAFVLDPRVRVWFNPR